MLFASATPIEAPTFDGREDCGLVARPRDVRGGRRRRLVRRGSRQLAARLVLRRLQRAFDTLTRLRPGRRRPAAAQRVVLLVYGGLLCLTVRLHDGPHRLHPAAGQGLLRRQRRSSPTPPRSHAPKRSSIASSRTLAESMPGVAHTIDLPGYSILTRHERLEHRHDVRGSRAVRGTGRRTRSCRPTPISSQLRAEVRRACRRPGRRVRRPAGRRPRQHRRLQAPWSRTGAALGLRDAAGGPSTNLVEPGDQPAGDSPASFTSLPRRLPADLRRHRPREGQGSMGVPSTTSSRPCRSTSARSTSTTSPASAATGRSTSRPTPPSACAPSDLPRLEVRNHDGEMVPLGTLVDDPRRGGPAVVNRYNMYPGRRRSTAPRPRAELRPGHRADGPARRRDCLPSDAGIEWTELTLLQILAAGHRRRSSSSRCACCFVFLVLAASTRAGRCRWRSC